MNIIVLAWGGEGGAPSSGTLELLGAAGRIAGDLSGTVIVAALGAGAVAAADAFGSYGASKVLTIADDSLSGFDADAYLDAATAACKSVGDAFVLVPGDRLGWEIAPRLAHRLEAGLVTDAVDVGVEEGRVVMTKPVYGGKALAKIAAKTATQVALVRERTVAAAEAGDGSATVESFAFEASGNAGRVKVVEHVAAGGGDELDIEDASIVVGGGRGLGGPEAFAELEAIADMLGGAVGATLAAVDAGWVPATMQIGQTGKAIAPDLYIAVGISGASQHVAGITSSKTIVAINKDADAPIFRYAHVGVVGDYKQVLPAFTDELRKVKG